MKKYLAAASVAIVVVLTGFQSAHASGGPYAWYEAVGHPVESKFSLELKQQAGDDVISASVENPGRKNLSLTLHGPDGTVIDNFFTGRKFVKLSKNYNFTGAEEGLYTIVVSDGTKKIERQVKFERWLTKSVSRLTID
ncbi:MAG: hypothetical protein ABIU63_18485 [Chitinophagaceae bacterium]